MSKKRIRRKKRFTSLGTSVILSMNYYKKLDVEDVTIEPVVIFSSIKEKINLLMNFFEYFRLIYILTNYDYKL